MALNRINKNMIDPNFVKQVDDNTTQLADNTNKIGILNKKVSWTSVTEYGADPTGVNDCTTAFQSAINQANGGMVFFPKGNYLVLGEVVIPSNTTLLSENNANIYFGDNGYFKLLNNAQNITIEGINFYDNLKYTTVLELGGSPFGTKIRVAQNVFAVGDWIGGSNYGISDKPYATITAFDGTWYTLDTPISNNGSLLRSNWGAVVGTFKWKAMIAGGHLNHETTIKRCTFNNAMGYSIALPRSNDILIEDCKFKNNGLDFVLIFSENPGEVISNIRFKNCIFDTHIDFGKQAIVPNVNDGALIENLIIEGCYFNKISESACSFDYGNGQFKTVRILNNVFKDIDLDAVCVGGEDIIIEGNQITGNNVNGVIRIGGYSGSQYTSSSKIKNVRVKSNTIDATNGITVNHTQIGTTGTYVEPEDIVIENNNIKAVAVGIVVGGKHIKVLNNVVRSTSGTGDSYNLAAFSLLDTAEDVIVRGNTFYEKALVKWTNNNRKVLIEQNVFNPDGVLGDTILNLYGVNTDPNTDIVVRDNTIYQGNSFLLVCNGETGHNIEFVGNIVIKIDGTKIIVPRMKNMNARFNNTESFTANNGWLSNIDNHWMNRIYLPNTYLCGTMPTEGYWTKGDFVLNSNPTEQGIAGSKYIVLGWLRLTTGTGNVLNTDWEECRVFTGN